MSVSTFSPKTFFELATGEPIDLERLQSDPLSKIPTSGLTIVPNSSDGLNHRLWITGFIGHSIRRSRFIEEVRHGEIPHPLDPGPSSSLPTKARFISIQELYTTPHSIATLLDIVPGLIDAAKESNTTACPSCAAKIPVFGTPTSLTDEISRTWSGRQIEIRLAGPNDTISAWALSHGFTLQQADDGTSIVRIDTFTCTKSGCEALLGVLGSTQRLTHSWLIVTEGTAIKEYAWHGRCAACQCTLPPFRRLNAQNALERGSVDPSCNELNRIVGGVSLNHAIKLPLAELLAKPFYRKLLSHKQLIAIQEFGLETLALAHLSTSLTIHSLVSLALVCAANDSDTATALVLEAPLSHLEDKQRTEHIEFAKTLGKDRPVVWLSDSPSSTHLSVASTPSSSSTTLGTLTLNQNRYPITCGTCLHISNHTGDGHTRISSDIYRAIQGAQTGQASFTAEHPFSEHFIAPFCANSSSVRLVAHELGSVEPLARLFAASHHAKMLGITARDLTLAQLKQPHTICSSCKGTGLILKGIETHGTEASPCPACWGVRFRSPAREVTFKGRTLWELLNAPITASQELLRTLPKMRETIELVTLFELQGLVLGMPLTLVSAPHRRILSIIRAMVSATTTRPALIILEEPLVGASDQQICALQKAISLPPFSNRVSWIVIGASTR